MQNCTWEHAAFALECGSLLTNGRAHAELLFSTFHMVIPQKLRETYVIDLKQVAIPVLMPEPEDIRINAARLLTNMAGLGFSLWYAMTKHFLANNGMGLAYSIEVCPLHVHLTCSVHWVHVNL